MASRHSVLQKVFETCFQASTDPLRTVLEENDNTQDLVGHIKWSARRSKVCAKAARLILRKDVLEPNKHVAASVFQALSEAFPQRDDLLQRRRAFQEAAPPSFEELHGKLSSLASDRERLKELQLLEGLRDGLVRERLEKTIQDQLWLDLRATTRPDAVRPRLVLRSEAEPAPDARSEPVPGGIAQAFAETKGRLLVLGPPGGGKTCALLDLTRSCIDRAVNDPGQALPVYLSLSSA